MNKAQLIDLLAQRMDGDKRAASAAVEGVVDIVVRTVQAGENVTITGFGVFERRGRAARVARNPRTGETVHVAPTSVPSFRPGTTFKAVVSGAAELPADAPAVKRTASRTRAAATKTAATKTAATKTAATKTAAAKTAAAKTAAAKTAAAKTAVKRAAPARATTSVPKTAAAKAAAKAAAASAPPKPPKVEKPAKGKKVDDKKKKAKPKK